MIDGGRLIRDQEFVVNEWGSIMTIPSGTRFKVVAEYWERRTGKLAACLVEFDNGFMGDVKVDNMRMDDDYEYEEKETKAKA